MERHEFSIKREESAICGVLENAETSKGKTIVLFIHGSGDSDRNGTVSYQGKIISQNFKVLANHIVANNLAVCRYDKNNSPNIEKTIEDAKQVISFLKEKYDFDKIILYGWSEGVRVIAEIINDGITVDGLILQSGLATGWNNYFKYILGEVTLNKLNELDSNEDGIIEISDFAKHKSDFSSSAFAIDTILLRNNKNMLYFNPLITSSSSIKIEDEWKKLSAEIAEEPSQISNYCEAVRVMNWDGCNYMFKGFPKPVLVIHGLNDGWVDPLESVKLTKSIGKNASLHLFPDLGHSMQEVDLAHNDTGGEIEKK